MISMSLNPANIAWTGTTALPSAFNRAGRCLTPFATRGASQECWASPGRDGQR